MYNIKFVCVACSNILLLQRALIRLPQTNLLFHIYTKKIQNLIWLSKTNLKVNANRSGGEIDCRIKSCLCNLHPIIPNNSSN